MKKKILGNLSDKCVLSWEFWWFTKVHVFWEDHKNLKLIYFCLILVGRFLKFFSFFYEYTKGQIISKWFLVSSNSSKKRTNEFFLLLWRLVFVRFLEEIEDTKNHFEIIWPLALKYISNKYKMFFGKNEKTHV